MAITTVKVKSYVGQLVVRTDASCIGSFSATVPAGVPVSKSLTATATSLSEYNTSEFSIAAGFIHRFHW